MAISDKAQQALDATLATAGWNTTKVGAATTGIGWLLSSQGAATVGILGVIVGLLMQWHFGRRKDKREQAESDLRIVLMRDKIELGDEDRTRP